MNVRELISAAVAHAGVQESVREITPLAGGCIHRVMRVDLASGTSVVAKIASAAHASLLEEERAGLRALREAGAVRVPEPIALYAARDASVLLTEFLPAGSPTAESWRRFGEDLAALHQREAGARYGFDHDNHLGLSPQPNAWHDDWVEFSRVCRLGHQLVLAKKNALLTPAETQRIERVIQRLDQLIPRRPKPALLHGDLWSGNALPTVDTAGHERIAVIDPACSIGDGYSDIAMMQLFGGFPRAVYEAYDANTSDREQRQTRIAVYQLYHVLNHVNLFGRSYAAQAMSIAHSLGA